MPKQMPSPSRVIADVSMPKGGRERVMTLQYPLLTRSNYGAWLIKMWVNLQAQCVWNAIEHDEDDEQTDRLALAAIYQGVSEDLLLTLAEKDSAKEAWEMHKTMHMGAERVKEAKVQTLKSEFEVLRMKNGESVDDFAMKLTAIVNGIRSLGDKVEEVYVVKKLLRAVPPKFLQIVTSIEQFGDLKTMTMEEMIGHLKVHEERLRSYGEKEENGLLLTCSGWVSRTKKNDENGGDSRGRGCDKSKIKCYNCDVYGHYASECQNPRRNREEANLIYEANADEEQPLL